MPNRRTLAPWIAAACGLLAVLVWVVAFRTGSGRAADLAALQGFSELRDTWPAVLAERIAHLCDPAPFALLSMALCVVALITRGVRAALVVAAILILPNVLTQELKIGLAEDRPDPPLPLHPVEAVSWPSGHSTAAMALALSAVIAAPATLRWLVAVAGALFAVIVGYAVVLLGWHMPSDVLGGFAIAGGGAALGVGLLKPAPAGRDLPLAGAAAAVLVLGAGALLLRIAVDLPSTRMQAAFLAFGVAIGVLGLALSGALAGAFSRPAARAALRSRSRRATG